MIGELKLLVKYTITKGGNNGDLKIGDDIQIMQDSSIWVERGDDNSFWLMPKHSINAMKGAEYSINKEWLSKETDFFRKRLGELESLNV